MAVQSSHTGMLHMLPNNSKISFGANIGTKVSLLTFDQLFYAFISLKPRVHTNSLNV